MSKSNQLAPVGGWANFGRSAELTEALWALGSDGQWHYLNFVAGSSVWESRRDASTMGVFHDGADRVVELWADAGHASESIAPLVAQFELVPSMGDEA